MKNLLTILLLIMSCTIISAQTKYYVPAEDAYLKIEFEDDNKNIVEEYAGLYEFLYPGFLETGEYAGDGMYEGINLNFENGVLSIKFERDVEGQIAESEAFTKYMFNPEIYRNKLTFDYLDEDKNKFEGTFVKGKYKNKNNRKITISGILRKENIYGTSNYFYNFYIKKN